MNTARRPCCPHCERPLRACLCPWVSPTDNDTPVLILQHPQEVKQAKGSARLLHMSLRHCRMLVGETFDTEAMQALPTPAQTTRQAVLLYPASAQMPAPTTMPTSRAGAESASPTLLVVLDGTWRKSLKMLHLNPILQTLPRLALDPDSPSRYAIRKARRADQLSTLEATCLALGQLEQAPARYDALRTAFDRFVTAVAARKQPAFSAFSSTEP